MKVLPIEEAAFDSIVHTIRLQKRNKDNVEIDLNSTLIVCNAGTFNGEALLHKSSWLVVSSNSSKYLRRAIYIPNNEDIDRTSSTLNTRVATIVLTHTNIFNLNKKSNERIRIVRSEIDYDIALHVVPKTLPKFEPKFATKLIISPVGSCQNADSAVVDVCLRNYFRHFKYLREGDLIRVNVEKYFPEIILSSGSPRMLYFKAIIIQGVEYEVKEQFADIEFGYLVDSENTTLHLDFNKPVESFLPAIQCEYNDCMNNSENSGLIDAVIAGDFCNVIPDGFEKLFEDVERAILPFLLLPVNQIKLTPVFLVSGKNGTGKMTFISGIAKRYGLHYLEKNCVLIQNSQPTQTESILASIFSNISKCSPCILHFRNIEGLCEDESGNRDDRTVDYFIKIVKTMSTDLPVFIFCSTSRESKVSPSLQRLCLQIIRLNELNENSRSAMMKWVVKRIGYCTDPLNEIARATLNFVYADLVQLVCRATSIHVGICNSYFESISNDRMTTLRKQDFHTAVNDMNDAFADAIGAPQIPNVTWDDVGGLTDLKEEILSSLLMQTSSSRLQRSGLLLYGPPGTGKTLLAKAVATECKYNFLSVKGPELLNMYVGQSEQNIREVFARARESAPCIIFFDELDSLAPRRGQSGGSGSVMDRVVSQLLAEMDGIQKKTGIFVLAATNRPDLIDSALLRPGRLDKMLFVGKCDDETSKINILKALTRKFKFAETFNWEDVIKRLPSQSVTGADLYGICSNAWLNAARRLIKIKNTKGTDQKDVLVIAADITEAIKKLKPDDLMSD